MQNFTKLSAAVHELTEEIGDDAENNTAVTSTGSNDVNLRAQGGEK